MTIAAFAPFRAVGQEMPEAPQGKPHLLPMEDEAQACATRDVTFLLMPGFCFFSVTAAVEAFAMANRLARRAAYRWRFVSVDDRQVMSSLGIALECGTHMDFERLGIGAIGQPDMVFIPSDLPKGSALMPRVRHYLNRLKEAGAVLVGLGRGALLLAEAGLLDGRRCASHWQLEAEFDVRFPRVETDGHLYELDEGLVTCAGNTASLDLVLALVKRDFGIELASRLCDHHVVEQVRPSRHRQRRPDVSAIGISNPRLASVITLMKDNLAPPLPLAALARRVGMSRRQIERLFELEGQQAPTRFYLQVRLEKAQQLLRRTLLPVVDVGKACGFISASHFSKCYRKRFGHSPRQEREGDAE